MPQTNRVAHFIRQAARRAQHGYRAQRRHFHFYKYSATPRALLRRAVAVPLTWRRRHWFVVGTVLALTTLVGIFVPRWANATRDPGASALTILPLAVPPLPAGYDATAAIPAGADWRTLTVRAGETVDAIFRAQGVAGADLQQLLSDPDTGAALRHIHPGDEFAFAHAADGSLHALRFDRDQKTRVTVDFDADGMHQQAASHALEQRTQVAHGVLAGSLFDAAERAGMSDAMVMKLADVFQYDIDFIKDIRAGDSFTVIYDSVYQDGAFLHSGDILAAEFDNRGHRYTAYRYTLPDGSVSFYSEDGRPLRKSLLRTPVKFTRISSRFSMARSHPILGYTRAHKGVDYAAPTGTPIHAAGDGVIAYRGWENGYGRFVLIRHNAEYSTAYGHMSGFAPKLHVGSHVRQGEVIGFVGMTGLATGPHLHYEVRVYGTQRNPLTVTMPKPEPLAPALRTAFMRQTQPLQARLNVVDGNLRLARTAPASVQPQAD